MVVQLRHDDLDYLAIVERYFAVIRHDGDAVCKTLGDKHAIRRIFVVKW